MNYLGRLTIFVAVLAFLPISLMGQNPDGDLRIEIISAHNLVVDPSVNVSGNYSPSAFYIAARVCNDGGNDLTDVTVNVGDFAAGNPGVYPLESAFVISWGGFYWGDFRLEHQGGVSDATRYLGTIPGGECVTVYWLVQYNPTDDNNRRVYGSWRWLSDDLELRFDVWATGNDGGTGRAADDSHYVNHRYTPSRSDNKVWPSSTNHVPAEYLNIISETLGWSSEYSNGSPSSCPGGSNILAKGIWFDLGEVDRGIDNNGDFVPDFNAWLQPVGDADFFSADCFRLVRTYGILIVKLSGGGTQVIQFEDQFYFSDIPSNNGVVGFVIYEYAVLNGPCSSQLTPYQVVAIGRNVEGYNSDFGTGITIANATSPATCVSYEESASAAEVNSLPANITYTLSAENLSAEDLGQPAYQLPLVIHADVPDSVQYIAGSAAAANTLPVGLSGYTIRYSTDHGITWTLTEPVPASQVTNIQWWFDDALPGLATAEVTYDITIPGSYSTNVVRDQSTLSFGNANPFTSDTSQVLIVGPNTICGTVYGDDGGTTGGGWNQSQDGDEAGLENVTVYLYVDVDADGVLDLPPDSQYNTGPTVTLIGGHFDVDTENSITPWNTGTVDGHVHEYDLKYGKLGVDMFNVISTQLHNITEDITDGNQKFKLILSNADLSPGGKLVINKTYIPGNVTTYERVKDYDNTPLTDLPIYSLNGVAGSTQLTELGIYFDIDAIGNSNLIPTLPWPVMDNEPGREGEWRNGALTIQAVAVNPDGTDNFTTNPAFSNGGLHGTATSGLLYECMVYWHWDGVAYDENPDFEPGDGLSLVVEENDGIFDYLWGPIETDANGNFCFDKLPDGNYLLLVDKDDSDLPGGYIETADTLISVDLDPNEVDANAVSDNNNDYGFGPPLLVNKRLTSDNPAYEGDTLSFSINVSNRSDLPLALTPLADTFDADRLEFLYAIPDPTSSTTGGTSPFANTGLLEWDNIGGVSGTEPIIFSDSLPAMAHMLGYWTFNEGTGSAASDYSGNGHTGTLQSSPSWVTGQYGNALDFDNAYVEIPHHADFDLSQMTIAAWVNFDVAADNRGILTKGTTTFPYGLEMAWPVANGNFNDDNFAFSTNFGLGVNDQSESDTEIFPGEWHHVAVTYDGSTARFFLDGVLDGETNMGTSILTNSESLILGANIPGAAYFDGKIDEVALYDKPLTEAEIAQLMMFNSLQIDMESIVLNWPMEEGTGTVLNDMSGKGITGTLVDGPAWNLGAVGTFGVDFDGVNDHMISEVVNQALDNTFAMSFWVRSSAGGSQFLISQDHETNDPDGEWWISNEGSGYIRFEYRNGGTPVAFSATSGTLTDGVWHHVVVNYNGSDLTFYRDGTQVGSFTPTFSLPDINAPVWLAKDTRANTDHLNGRLDHVYIFDDSMSTSEITELYQSHYPSYAPFGGDCPRLIGSWELDEGTGTTTRDESGMGLTGTLTNGPAWTPAQSGPYGLDFSGNSLEYVDFGTTDLNLGSNFSIAFWVKSDGTDYLETILAKGAQGTAGHFQLYLNYGELYFRTDAPGTIDVGSGYLFNDSTWHHVVVNYNGGAIIFYVDGSSVSSSSQTFTIPALNAQMTLGRRPDVGTNEFNSELDQLKIYNCALSNEQINRLIELGTIEDLSSQEVQVFFLARDPAGFSTGTSNSVCVSGALFTDGRAANNGCDVDLANITIFNTGTLTGRIWSDADGDGWQGTDGYEAGEGGFASVRVVLEGCTDYLGGGACNVPITRDTITTDVNGDYLFTGLRHGTHYRVVPIAADIPDAAPTLTGDPDDDPVRGSGDGGTCGGGGGSAPCDNAWDNGGAWFEMLVDSWGGENENLTNINFGYQITGSIYGLVWNDIDGDGVRDAGEPMMENVMVQLSSNPPTMTDENGVYSFGNLAPGSYTINVNVGSLPFGGTWTETGESDATINNSITVTLTLGESDGSHEFGWQATGLSMIGDQLFFDWNGDGVQDANEEGIPNITMNLYRDINDNGLRDISDILLATTVTDQDGYYEFLSLPAGSYLVGVDEMDADFPQATQTADPDESGTCSTCDGWAASYLNGFFPDDFVDFGYRPLGTTNIGDLVWLDLNADGNDDGLSETGIFNITLTLYVDLNQDNTFENVLTTRSDINGNYSFSNLPNGNYRIVVDSTNAFVPIDQSGYPYSLTTPGVLDFTIANGAISVINGVPCTGCNLDLDFGFTRKAMIGDMVYWDSNNNGTMDQSEAGVSGVTVYLCEGDVNCTSGNAVATTTTSDGTDGKAIGAYLFRGLDANTYTVAVETGSGPLVGATQTADPESAGMTCDDPNLILLGYPACDNSTVYNLGAGAVYSGADFGYLATGVIGDFIWNDQDSDGIQDPGEQGLPGVMVYLCNGTGACDSLAATDSIRTDLNGYFTFDGLLDGDYRITVIRPDGYAATTGAESIGDTTATVTISSAAVSNIDGTNCTNCDLNVDFGFAVVGTHSLSGTICMDDGTMDGVCTGIAGETAQGSLTIYLSDSGGSLVASTTTDAFGNYSFSNLTADTYEVSLIRAFPPLSDAVLTTTNADVPAGGTITESLMTVNQSIPVAANVTDADFAFFISSDFDFGDLPNPYYTTTNANPLGAYHLLPPVPNLYLGSLVDAESNGIQSGDAVGDDTDNLDDEDGVAFINQFGWSEGDPGTGNGGEVSITVAGTGYLVAWVDFNKDGDFTDPGEMIISQAVSTGTANYQFAIPFGTVFTGEFFFRFRLFDTAPIVPAAAYSGIANNGEVEDYNLSFAPLPIELLGFKARQEGPDALVSWTTTNEIQARHFELERSVDGTNFQKIHTEEAKGVGQNEDYRYLDPQVVDLGLPLLYYRLKKVNQDGSQEYSDVVELNLKTGSLAGLSVFPNPASKTVNVRLYLNEIEAPEMRVVSSLGQVLWEGNPNADLRYQVLQIDVSKWAAGIYYLELSHEQGGTSHKFMVN